MPNSSAQMRSSYQIGNRVTSSTKRSNFVTSANREMMATAENLLPAVNLHGSFDLGNNDASHLTMGVNGSSNPKKFANNLIVNKRSEALAKQMNLAAAGTTTTTASTATKINNSKSVLSPKVKTSRKPLNSIQTVDLTSNLNNKTAPLSPVLSPVTVQKPSRKNNAIVAKASKSFV